MKCTLPTFPAAKTDPLRPRQVRARRRKTRLPSANSASTRSNSCPSKNIPGDYSWGYNPRYFFAAQSPATEPQKNSKNLIDECHGRGIRVIIDGIYNHSESSSPLTQIDHDLLVPPRTPRSRQQLGPGI